MQMVRAAIRCRILKGDEMTNSELEQLFNESMQRSRELEENISAARNLVGETASKCRNAIRAYELLLSSYGWQLADLKARNSIVCGSQNQSVHYRDAFSRLIYRHTAVNGRCSTNGIYPNQFENGGRYNSAATLSTFAKTRN
jgi:hypothetical protein